MNSVSKMICGTALAALLALGGAVPPAATAAPQPAISASADPAQQALTALAASPNSPLPAGTKVRSVVLQDGIATVDFSREFKDHFQGGDSDEAAVVNSILKTLSQFPAVDQVRILVEGQRLDSLGGTLDLSQALPVIRLQGPNRLYLHRAASHAKIK